MSIQILNANLPPPEFPMASRSLSDITDLIVHHSDGSPDQTPQDIDAEHRAQGWAMCGYNFILTQDGRIWQCRPNDVVPSAAYGRNAQSVDVCLLGDFQPGTEGAESSVPSAQLASLEALALYLHQQYPSIVRTIGHRDVATLFYPSDPGDYSTACPGQVLEDQLPTIKAYVLARLQH